MSRIEIFKIVLEIFVMMETMKGLMFKIVCEAMQRADDIEVLDDKIRQLKLSIEILEDKLDRFFI